MKKMKLIMALKIWLAIYPSITLFLYVFNDAMAALSLPVKTLIITLILVPWIVFAAIPMINYVVHLFSNNKS